MDGLLRLRAPILSGIVNGIDTATWDPATDPRIAARYDRSSLALRSANKAALQARFGLEPSGDRLLFGVVSRLTWQKGIDLLAAAVPSLLAMQAQLVVLGTGEADLERQLVASARAHPGQIGCEIGYDEDLAHLIQAGADALLVPSRFEPCGLTQLCAQRYGALPVVSKVGGLADTVVDLGTAPQDGHPTGIQFAPVDTPAFETALRRTRDLWADQVLWRQVQQNAMASDVSWQASAARYARLYKDMLARQD
jgi:starch synthase